MFPMFLPFDHPTFGENYFNSQKQKLNQKCVQRSSRSSYFLLLRQILLLEYTRLSASHQIYLTSGEFRNCTNLWDVGVFGLVPAPRKIPVANRRDPKSASGTLLRAIEVNDGAGVSLSSSSLSVISMLDVSLMLSTPWACDPLAPPGITFPSF
jgi:hypothetical protein